MLNQCYIIGGNSCNHSERADSILAAIERAHNVTNLDDYRFLSPTFLMEIEFPLITARTHTRTRSTSE